MLQTPTVGSTARSQMQMILVVFILQKCLHDIRTDTIWVFSECDNIFTRLQLNFLRGQDFNDGAGIAGDGTQAPALAAGLASQRLSRGMQEYLWRLQVVISAGWMTFVMLNQQTQNTE